MDRDLDTLCAAAENAVDANFADDVRFYLSQQPRQLPCRYFYDALGSALFNAICELPWYTLTRAESRLLDRHGRDILTRAAPLRRIVELGSGDGRKLACLLDARRPGAPPLDVHLIDISPAALAEAERAIAQYDNATVVSHHATYETGLERMADAADGAGRTLTLFLGSNIGNFDPPSAGALLRYLRCCQRSGDLLLLGADLIKPARDLRLAYDDPLGVTAAFNLNLLTRMNRELGADFDLSGFAHVAIWNGAERRMEMHLRSQRRQRVTVTDADLDIMFEAGEMIWTESSYKYDLDGVGTAIKSAGFAIQAQWVDRSDCFSLTLAEAV